MKQIFNFFFLLICLSLQAQEENKEQVILEFKPPLNLTPCANCIDKNPEVTINITEQMELLLTQVINDSNEILIPVEMFIDNKGFVNKIYLSNSVSPFDQKYFTNSNIDNLLTLINETRIVQESLSFSDKYFIKGIMLLKLTKNSITILNQ
jgi:hypothetical protein